MLTKLGAAWVLWVGGGSRDLLPPPGRKGGMALGLEARAGGWKGFGSGAGAWVSAQERTKGMGRRGEGSVGWGIDLGMEDWSEGRG
ncbi:hypothetical protein GBA52_010783 [Prunus armeniaca]|nr:hypothetical protein GBA52_010783 [Prunus armeniaca]